MSKCKTYIQHFKNCLNEHILICRYLITISLTSYIVNSTLLDKLISCNEKYTYDPGGHKPLSHT